MKLNCYRNLNNCLLDISVFAVFKSENKYVVGFTVGGEKWLLPERVRLKWLLEHGLGLMRVSRSVLVAREYVEGVTGSSDERLVYVLGHQFKLSRDELTEPFLQAVSDNIARRAMKAGPNAMGEIRKSKAFRSNGLSLCSESSRIAW